MSDEAQMIDRAKVEALIDMWRRKADTVAHVEVLAQFDDVSERNGFLVALCVCIDDLERLIASMHPE